MFRVVFRLVFYFLFLFLHLLLLLLSWGIVYFFTEQCTFEVLVHFVSCFHLQSLTQL